MLGSMKGVIFVPDVLENLKDLFKKGKSKMVLLVADGLGGIPHPDFDFKTELEAAHTPNLDRLAQRSVLGLMYPVNYGITPGSGPGHIGLFGYNPEEGEFSRLLALAWLLVQMMWQHEPTLPLVMSRA
jgi:hypothetical protein